MKYIKIYNTDAAYQIALASLPEIHVAYSIDNDSLHFGGVKKVVDYITEEEYGTAVFDVFRTQGWIAEDAHVMSVQEAKAVTDLGRAFYNNTEIEDATFLRYFTGLTDLTAYSAGQWKGFNGCTNLKKIVIPRDISGGSDLCAQGILEYVEILEGVTAVGQLLRASSATTGCIVVFPSTLTGLASSAFARITSADGVLDLRHTSITSIGNSVFYRSLSNKEVYLPSTLTRIGTGFMNITTGLEYIEFNSDTSLTIGDDCVGRDPNATYTNITVNFKNDIPITIGNKFGYGINKKSNVIFHSTTPPTIGTDFFSRSRSSTEIYVPVGHVSDYEAVANLSNFVGRIYEIGGEEWTAAGLDKYNS